MYSDFKDLTAYKKGFEQAMNLFTLSIRFPAEERFSLTDQIRRSSRSVCTNLAEAYRKRIYPKHYFSKITDCLGENSETEVWIDFAFNCNYISQTQHQEYCKLNSEVGKLLTYMFNNPDKFGVKES